MAPVDELVGSWRLERFCSERSGEAEAFPLGDAPDGLLTYTADGVMSVHLLADPDGPQTRMDAYTGYYGSYSIDEDAAVISHHVEGASVERLAGTVQDRNYRLDGDRLELSALVSGANMTLTWKRR